VIIEDERRRRVPVDERRIERWLVSLRDGSEAEKIGARRGLAGVFEGRGMLAEAIDLLERNLDAGVRSPETLRWLSRLYQKRDDGAECPGAAATRPPQSLPVSGQVSDGEAPVGPTWDQPIRDLAPYVAMVIGLGAAIGTSAWMLAPLLAR